jgi:hypothetical protein
MAFSAGGDGGSRGNRVGRPSIGDENAREE